MDYVQNSKIAQVTEKTLVVSVDIGSETNFARAFNWRGQELSIPERHNSNRSRAQIKRSEREKFSVRAKIEHIFDGVKQQLRFRKTRYRGLRKQTAKLNILFALANLILADRPCLAA